MKLLSDNATYRIDADPDDETKLTATFRIRSCRDCPHYPLDPVPHLWEEERFDTYEIHGPPRGLHFVTERTVRQLFVCWG